jgi:phosphatidylinositol kinase/protein kinase (PI-3  family)
MSTLDTLPQTIGALKHGKQFVRQNAANALRTCVIACRKNMSGETFTAFMTDLNKVIFDLVSSNEKNSKLGGILAIKALIDVDHSESEVQVIRFANCLRVVFQQQSQNVDNETLIAAAEALGHLARAGGTLTVDFVNFEVTRALEWLQSDRQSSRRLVASLVLKELAENAPVLFYSHVGTFFEYVVVVLSDKDKIIRQSATKALRACLQLIFDRDSRWRLKWYYKVYDMAQQGFSSGSADSLHGALLVTKELLENTGDFMVPRFNEVCQTVYKCKDHRDRLIRDTIVTLSPALATFSPDAFVHDYLAEFMDHLVEKMAKSSRRGIAFLAVGQMAVAVGRAFVPYLDRVLNQVHDALNPKSRRGLCLEALPCVSSLSVAAPGPELLCRFLPSSSGLNADSLNPPELDKCDLLERMFDTGLSKALIDALEQIGECVPSLLSHIQFRLVEECSLILDHTVYRVPGSNGNDGLFSGSSSGIFPKSWNSSHKEAYNKKKEKKAMPSTPREALKKGRKMVGAALAKRRGVDTGKDRPDGLGRSKPSPRLAPHYFGGIGLEDDGFSISQNASDDTKDGDKTNGGLGRKDSRHQLLQTNDHPGHNHLTKDEAAIVILALKTLATFNMKGLILLPFVRNVVSEYLKNPNVIVRTQAVDTCMSLLITHSGVSFSERDKDSVTKSCLVEPQLREPIAITNANLAHQHVPFAHGRTRTARFRCETLSHVLTLAVADRDAKVRKTAIAALRPQFDRDLAQAEMLRSLFVALNDEIFEIREMGIVVVGRLTGRNPAYVMPLLRKTLVQLLTELEYSNDSCGREESSRLLALLIKASKSFVRPYLSRIISVLMPRLQDPHAGVATSVLCTLGELSEVGGVELIPYCKEIFPLVINVIQDQGSIAMRTIAIRTLGQLVQSTGLVVKPFIQHQGLLDLIVSELEMGQGVASPPELRVEVMRTLGAIGAIDPYSCKGEVAVAFASEPRELAGNSEVRGKVRAGRSVRGHRGRTLQQSSVQVDSGGSPSRSLMPKYHQLRLEEDSSLSVLDDVTSPSQELYYPKVTISALVRILKDTSLNAHHSTVAQAIMHICRATQMKCIPFMPQIVPTFLHVMHNCEHGLRESLCQQLGQLVSIVKQHIRGYLPGILKLIHEFWDDNCEQILTLVEHLSLALKDEMKTELPKLIPLLLSVFSPSIQRVDHAFNYDPTRSQFGKSVQHGSNVLPSSIGATGADRFNFRILGTEQNHTMKRNGANYSSPAGRVANSSSTTIKALHTLEVLDSNLVGYLHLIVPALVSVIEDTNMDTISRIEGLKTLSRLNHSLGFVEYGSRIIHSILRVLDNRGLNVGKGGGDGLTAGKHGKNGSTGQGKNPHDESGVYMLHASAISALCGVAQELGRRYAIFIPVVADVLYRLDVDLKEYNAVVETIMNGDTFVDSYAHRRVKVLTSSPNARGVDERPVEYASGAPKLGVDQQTLLNAWAASQRSNRDDWFEWLRRFSVELLRQSPQPSLRSCSACAQLDPLARELFNAAFISCWGALSSQYQEWLVRALETAFQSPAIPPEIVQVLLNLAEFMEHDGKALPIDIRTLAMHATRCHAFAKALHYKEIEFRVSPVDCTEALISIYNSLEQPEAAFGVLLDVQKKAAKTQEKIVFKESWFEKLGRWDEALEKYDKKREEQPESVDAMVGQLRSLHQLWEWDRLSQLAKGAFQELTANEYGNAASELDPESSNGNDESLHLISTSHAVDVEGGDRGVFVAQGGPERARIGTHGSDEANQRDGDPASLEGVTPLEEVGYLGAHVAWTLGQWDEMATYVKATNPNSLKGAYFRAIINVHHDRFDVAQKMVDRARGFLDKAMTAMLRESYNRAYKHIVLAQELTEIEEIITYRQMALSEESKSHIYLYSRQEGQCKRTFSGSSQKYLEHIKRMWASRLDGCQRSIDVWQRILSVRSLVLKPHEGLDTWLEFVRICRKAGNMALSFKTLVTLGWKGTSPSFERGSNSTAAMRRDSASDLERNIDTDPRIVFAALEHLYKVGEREQSLNKLKKLIQYDDVKNNAELLLRSHMRVGHWTLNLYDIEDPKNHSVIDIVLNAFAAAKTLDPQHFKAWDAWALMNYNVVKIYERLCGGAQAVCKRLERIYGEKRKLHGSSTPLKESNSLDMRLTPNLLNSKHTPVEPTEAAIVGGSIVNADEEGEERDIVPQMIMPNRSRRSNSAPAPSPADRHSAVLDTHAQRVASHLIPSIRSFFKSVTVILQEKDQRRRLVSSVLQDMLRVLTLWFDYGDLADVAEVMKEGFEQINIDIWLYVIPQLIARIHTPVARIQSLLHRLLCHVGRRHPQALIYSLTVASNASSKERQVAASAILKDMRRVYPTLVDQAMLVSKELIRIAILWHEQWHEGLEDASKLYFGENDKAGMLKVLLPLHEAMEKGPTTQREIGFFTAFSKELAEAYRHILNFKETRRKEYLDQAWDLYYKVFNRIHKSLPLLTTLELQLVSSYLMDAKNLDLAVPGTSFNFDWTEEDPEGEEENHDGRGNTVDAWSEAALATFNSATKNDGDDSGELGANGGARWRQRQQQRYAQNGRDVRIEYFARNIQVISSKQRPRKLSMRGSDGQDYVFLLKGHEDLRQDERVMQLFGLVNALLANDRDTRKRDLAIRRYSAIPLSHHVGIVGWVPHCDTFHQLVREFREKRKIFLNIEQRLMLKMAPDYDHLTSMQKVEAFRYGLDKTNGQDLSKVLWLKSMNSEIWLERRTNYTRSLAVMSMVGYILGLGDRHPSNLMLDRKSGKIIHIDFGDCFEVAMQREKVSFTSCHKFKSSALTVHFLPCYTFLYLFSVPRKSSISLDSHDGKCTGSQWHRR